MSYCRYHRGNIFKMLTVPSPRTRVLCSALKTGLKLDLPNFLLFLFESLWDGNTAIIWEYKIWKTVHSQYYPVATTAAFLELYENFNQVSSSSSPLHSYLILVFNTLTCKKCLFMPTEHSFPLSRCDPHSRPITQPKDPRVTRRSQPKQTKSHRAAEGFSSTL